MPYLAQHFRVVVMDLRGNGKSDRPSSPHAYSFDHYFADFVAVLDRLEIERTAVVALSATTMVALRLAAEQPARVTHLVVAGGYADRRLDEAGEAGVSEVMQRMRDDWPAYLDEFFAIVFSEPHSTKPYDDGVRTTEARPMGPPSRWDSPAGCTPICASMRAGSAAQRW